MNAIEHLAKTLSRLPGIGPKSAMRLAFHLVRSDNQYNEDLASQIATIKQTIYPCPVCGSYTEVSPCPLCSDPNRDRSLLCVVEQAQDVLSLTASGAYNGLFHVLGGAISPLDGIGPDSLDFPGMLKRIREGSFKELIIATNPTESGDTTALYIRHLLKDHSIAITRLASGIPIGGDLEYADRLTLARSLRNRIKFGD